MKTETFKTLKKIRRGRTVALNEMAFEFPKKVKRDQGQTGKRLFNFCLEMRKVPDNRTVSCMVSTFEGKSDRSEELVGARGQNILK